MIDMEKALSVVIERKGDDGKLRRIKFLMPEVEYHQDADMEWGNLLFRKGYESFRWNEGNVGHE